MIEIIIKRLLEDQSRVAHETMERPGDGSIFEYGRRAGIYAGLGRAIAIIEETFTTIVVYPGLSAELSAAGNYILHCA